MSSRSLPPPTDEQTLTMADGTLPHGPPPSGPSLGSNLGRYLVLEEIGAGGMGVVVRAYDPKLQREVALKQLRADALDERAADRMIREAQAMAQLAHPNVVAVHDVEVLAPTVLLVMEFVEGRTLRAWLREQSPAWPEILEVFLQAGRGLAAAHAVDLVHRDFKPDNVLVGRDGRVRVTDFGLARAAEADADADVGADLEAKVPAEPSLAPSSKERVRSRVGSHDSFSAPMTMAGTVIGTPAYMAPEQHLSQGSNAQADQFAFCVALWEALVGHRPFVGEYKEVAAAKLHGPPPWPRDSPVPRAIHEALLRGLAPRPRDRWPSMDSLLSVLDRDPARSRQRWVTAAAFGIAGVATVGAVLGWQDRGPVCVGASEYLEGVWDDARRDALDASLRGTDVEYAGPTLTKVTGTLDDYAAGWVQMRTEACEASTVRGEQSAEVLDLRMECLDHRLMGLDATIEVLLDADTAVVERAVDMVSGLPGLSRCADIESLRAAVPPPEDPQLALAVEESRRALVRADARLEVGRHDEALAILDGIEASPAFEHPPVQVETAALRGLVLLGLGRYDDVERMLTDAYPKALRMDHRVVASQILSTLAFVIGTRQMREAESRWLSTTALAIAEELGNEPLTAVVLNDIGGVLETHAHYDEALATFERVLEIQTRLHPENSPVLSTTMSNMALALRNRGDVDEAYAAYERALSIEREAYGGDHPSIARLLTGMGNMMHLRGDYEGAVRLAEESLAMHLRIHGLHHPDSIHAMSNLGIVQTALGRYAEAEKNMRRALEVLEREMSHDDLEVVDTIANLAIAVEEQGRYDEALGLHQRALDVLRDTMGAEHPRTAISLNNVGGCLVTLRRYDEAVPLLEQAVKAITTAAGPDHPHVGLFEVNLGDALRGLGRYEEAEGHLRHAKGMIETTFGPEHIYYSHALIPLGRVLHARGGSRDEALAMLEQSMKLRTTVTSSAAKRAEAALASPACWAPTRPSAHGPEHWPLRPATSTQPPARDTRSTTRMPSRGSRPTLATSATIRSSPTLPCRGPGGHATLRHALAAPHIGAAVSARPRVRGLDASGRQCSEYGAHSPGRPRDPDEGRPRDPDEGRASPAATSVARGRGTGLP